MYPSALIELLVGLPAFLLVVSRVSGIMIMAPLLGSAAIPARIKAALVLVISAAVFPVLATSMPQDLTLPGVVSGLAGELVIGLLIGMGLSIILLAMQMTGMIVGQQAGLSLASVFDPATQTRSSVIGQIYFLVATAVFLLMDGHRAMIRMLLDSFESVPPMTFQLQSATVEALLALMMSSLELALKMAAPMIMALLIAKAGLGFLSRTMPQLHILSVGFAIFAGIGMLLSGMEMDNLYDVMQGHILEAFEIIGGALGLS